ncbi:hypothetical protein NO758_03206 [Planktothrix agardhii]|jgi:hypothetical protein|nr:hypothetical protein PCC7821_01179 [Planktothrix rubescens NIVA-CYA 18]CAD5937338.1 hypothetical protein NO108_02067 [Planktothrix rubescens]CAD5962010.1 hypothetical protein NO758_03206 [Planktothrix agardhii]CAH2571728.1 hypothetical protein PRNO82_01129 [Planktothrix rubescens]
MAREWQIVDSEQKLEIESILGYAMLPLSYTLINTKS